MTEGQEPEARPSSLATQRDRENAIYLYQNTQLTASEIGGMFGVTRQTVHAWVDAAGVPRRGQVPHRADREETTGEMAIPVDDGEPSDLAAVVAEMSRQVTSNATRLGYIEGVVDTLIRLQTERRRSDDPPAPQPER